MQTPSFQLSKMLNTLIKCASVKGTEKLDRKVSVNVSSFASDVLNCFGSLSLFITDRNIFVDAYLFTVCKCNQLRQKAVGIVIVLSILRN